MSLASKIALLATAIGQEIKAVRSEMSGLSGGSSSGNVDGGSPNTNYGGTTQIDGGTP